MKLTTFERLYVHELKDLYSGEKQMIEALPKVISKVRNSRLRKAFEAHLEETKKQKARLETIFEGLDFEPGGEKCDAMEGLIEENEEILKMKDDEIDERVRDAAIIAGAQRIEHYEMAGYGTARRFAERLGRTNDMRLLDETLDEEAHADDLLTDIAVEVVNSQAAAAE